MSSVIRYADAFSEEYNTSFQDAWVNNFAQNMGRTNFLYMKRKSTYERYAQVINILCGVKTVMTRIQKLEQIVAGEDSKNIGVRYLDSCTLKNVTEEILVLPLNVVEAFCSNSIKDNFDTNVSTALVVNF